MKHADGSVQTGPRRGMRSVLGAGVVVALIAGGALSMRSPDTRSATACDLCSREAEKPAAAVEPMAEVRPEYEDWTRLAATDLDGSPFAMAELEGAATVLYFWATWCPQCEVQRQILHTLTDERGGRLRVVALSVDEDAHAVRRYLGTKPSLTHELRASPELLAYFRVEVLPTVVVIDRTGAVRKVSAGPLGSADLERFAPSS